MTLTVTLTMSMTVSVIYYDNYKILSYFYPYQIDPDQEYDKYFSE